MTNVLSASAILLLVGSIAAAGEQSDLRRTGGFLNGRAWQEWSADVRLATVVGFYEGVTMANARHDDIYGPFKTRASFSEIVSGVDQVYAASSANLPIPIFSAIHVFVLRANGAPTAEIDAATASAIRAANKDQ